jgi:uncharacterized protein YuzE
MNIQYDKVADAIYMKLSDSPVVKTTEINDRLLVDIDSQGNTIGIEILEASSQVDLVENIEKNVPTGFPIQITESTPVSA